MLVDLVVYVGSVASIWAVPIAALVISVATFVLGQREMSRRASLGYVHDLEARIKLCEDDRQELRRETQSLREQTDRLEEENIRLMRRVLTMEQRNQ